MKKYLTLNNLLDTVLIGLFVLLIYTNSKQHSEIIKLKAEHLELKQRYLDVNDEFSAMEHELHSARNMVGNWTTFEYNEYLEEMCLRFGYVHTIHALNPMEGDSVLRKNITIHGDW